MKCKKDCAGKGCLACAKIEACIQRAVDDAPPLTDEQLARLSQLLMPFAVPRPPSPPREQDLIDSPASLGIEVRR